MLREEFMRTFRAGLILLTLAAAPLMAEGNQQATMHGVVTGKEGRPVQSAFVLVRDYQQSSQDTQKWETRTAGDGSFSLLMPPGCYDIFVSADVMLLPLSQRICIQADDNSILKIQLKTDPHPRATLS